MNNEKDYTQEDVKPEVLKVIKENMERPESEYVTFKTFEEFKKHIESN